MILKGAPVAEKIYKNLKKELSILHQKNITPSIGVILVGDDAASVSYVRLKEKIAEDLRINFQLFHLPGIVSGKEVEKLISDLNKNKYIDGIIIQLPMPHDFETEKILKLITPQKDIDGFYGEKFAPPTAKAILEILEFYKINLKGKKIVIVGHGRLVGQPLETILRSSGFRPIVGDAKTVDLKRLTQSADIIVTATGVPGLIKPEMVGSNTIIIDAGSAEAKGKIVGDVDPSVYVKVKAYTPVPGGVGPVTVTCLMKNVVEAAKSNMTK